jgi:peptidoglycan hydrolase-like protein with peptidoglycan-binding domain
VATTAPINSNAYVFSRNLAYNDKGADVLQLQKILVAQGFLTATPTGHYGPATLTAVKKFQKANNIRQTGNVGPVTLAALNKISSSVPNTTASAQSISSIQQEIQQLLAQVAQMQGQ